MLFGWTCFVSETDHASFLRRRRRRAAVQRSAGTQTGTYQDRYYPLHGTARVYTALGGIGRRTEYGDNGGPPSGGGGRYGLTAAMPCWLLLAAAAKQLLMLGTTAVVQQWWIELYRNN